MPLGRKVGLDLSDMVLDTDTASPMQKRVHSPQFSAHVYYGQTAGWIEMPLGMEVGLGPHHDVLYGDPASLRKKGHIPHTFWPMFIVTKRLDGSRYHLAQW